MVKNAYIHIPFCRGGKCNYCAFVSFPDFKLKNEYINSLKVQIKNEYNGEKLNTLYFGGGTPSIMTINELKGVIELFNLENAAEVTTEVNPDSVDFEYFKGLIEIGFNRLSIGSQSFDDSILRLIGRRHNSAQTLSALKSAQKAGFNNISLDFIYGLPTQTQSSFENDIKLAIDLGVQHISLYGLKIESGSYFAKNMPANLPDLDMQADMCLSAIEILKKAGFEHYEVSNFSLPGFNSQHNLNYWNNNSYYGFGCSASGYVDSVRYQMNPDLIKYIKNPIERTFEQKLTQDEILEEEIFLGLRKLAGINLDEINSKYKIDFDKKYSKTLKTYNDYFIRNGNILAFTEAGILISNEILPDFIS